MEQNKDAKWDLFKPESFFKSIIDTIVSKGYHFLSMVAIDNKDVDYHVDFISHARDTRMFFYHAEKAMIFWIGYTEDLSVLGGIMDNGTNIKSHWYFTIDCKYPTFLQRKWIEDEDMEEEYMELEGFTSGSSSSSGLNGEHNNEWQFWNETDGITVDEVIDCIIKRCDEELKDLSPMPFGDLQVTSWVPQYAFEGCNDIFWERFNRKDLKAIVKNPWGGGK